MIFTSVPDHIHICQATQLLRKMGVKSPIIGVTSESDQQAFIDAGADECLKMPLDTA
jgi:NADPH:quinone reductase-like Zn-dependent oxidoreductase